MQLEQHQQSLQHHPEEKQPPLLEVKQLPLHQRPPLHLHQLKPPQQQHLHQNKQPQLSPNLPQQLHPLKPADIRCILKNGNNIQHPGAHIANSHYCEEYHCLPFTPPHFLPQNLFSFSFSLHHLIFYFLRIRIKKFL